jgi:hypothetical protein
LDRVEAACNGVVICDVEGLDPELRFLESGGLGRLAQRTSAFGGA